MSDEYRPQKLLDNPIDYYVEVIMQGNSRYRGLQ